MRSIALLGGGGHASDVLCVVEALVRQSGVNMRVVIGDDNWADTERFAGRNVELVGSIEAAATAAPYVVAVGYPGGRQAVHERACAAEATAAAQLVDPASSIGSTARLGQGVVVMGQVWVSAGVTLADHVHVGYCTSIGHDTMIGAFGAVMPNAAISGDVTIGRGVLVGTNATILQGLTIGDGAVIGAGAVVNRDVAPGLTVAGSPARVLQAGEPHLR